MSKIINVGKVTAYADAVAGGYTGTREEWENDLANLGTTAAEVEANRQAVEADKETVAGDKETVEGYKDAAAQSASEAASSAGDAHVDALAATAAKEAAETAQGLAEAARDDAVAAKVSAETAQGAAETAQGAAEAAVTQASGYAGDAAGSATAAAGSAEEAAASAATAGEAAEDAQEVLESIPSDYSTLSSDVDDLKNSASKVNESLSYATQYAIDTNTYNRFISSGKWSNSNGALCGFAELQPDTYRVKITAGEEYLAVVAMLKTTVRTVGTTPDYATGWSAVVTIEIGESQEFDVPSDAKYLYFAKSYNDHNFTPSSINLINHMSGATVEGEIAYLIDTLLTYTDVVDFSELVKKNNAYINPSSYNWSSYSGYASYIVPVPDNCLSMTITANNNYKTTYALLKSVPTSFNTTPEYYDSRRTMDISARTTAEVTISPGIKYIYIYATGSSNSNRIPSYMDFKVRGIKQNASDDAARKVLAIIESTMWHKSDADNDDVPVNRGEHNMLRKAAQLRSLKWTPIYNVPNNTGHYSAGTMQTGIPYSSVSETRKYVGKDVSIRTFMTAVHNPYSLLYTENVSASGSSSGYGFTYHGDNAATYFGAVCWSYLTAACGIPENWITARYTYLYSIGAVEKIYDQSADGLRLGDIYSMDGHVKLVTGITRDEYSGVTSIILSESIGTSIRAVTKTAVAFNSDLASDHATIYRIVGLYKNLEYEPSPFVAVENETPETYQYNDDICTYAGDYAAFRCGESVWLNNYSATAYTGVKVYKGNDLLATVQLSGLTDPHKIDVTQYTETYGYYKACLTDGTLDSDYTYWQMIDANASLTKENNDITVSFSAHNGTPMFCYLCNIRGSDIGGYTFTSTDIANGMATFDAVKIKKEQTGSDQFTSTTYLRVVYRGDYGWVSNDWVNCDTGLYSE